VRLLACFLLSVLLVPSPAARAEERSSAQVVADAVSAARVKQDVARLTALARRDDPDPWLVVDVLCHRGDDEDAAAFARASPRPAVDALPVYVDARRGKGAEVPARGILTRVTEALMRKDLDGVLAAARDLDGPLDTVTRARIAFGAGHALLTAGEAERAITPLRRAGDAMRDLGWIVAAKRAYEETAQAAYRAQDWRAAIEPLREMFEIQIALGDRAGAAGTLANVGQCEARLELYEQALKTERRALDMMQEVGDLQGVALVLGNVGNLLTRLERYDEALRTQREALAALGAQGQRFAAARTLGNIGRLLEKLGRYPEALETQLACLAEMRALERGDGAARSLLHLGNAYIQVPDFPRALAAYHEALDLKRRLGDRRGEALVLANLGVAYEGMADVQRALNHGRRALALMGELGMRRDAATARANMANVHGQTGDLPRAIAMLESALAAQGELGHRAGAATTLMYLATLHKEIGDFDAALLATREAIELLAALGAGTSLRRARLYLGSIHEERGELVDALAALQPVLEDARAAGNRVDEAWAGLNIGRVLLQRREADEALGFFASAARIFDASGLRGEMARATGHMGYAAEAKGDLETARAHYVRAVEVAEALRLTPIQVRFQGALARLWLEADEAQRALADARAVSREMEDIYGGLGQAQGAAAREMHADVFEVGALAAARTGHVAECVRFLEAGRAGQLLEALRGRPALRYTDLPEELARAEQEADAVMALARHELRRARGEGDLETARAKRIALEEALTRRRLVSDRIWREAKRQAFVFYPRPAPLREIQRSLETGTALVLYGLCLDEVLAVVITRTGRRIVHLGVKSEVVAACEALQLERPHVDPRAPMARLRALLVTPLRLPAGTRRVLVSPAGPLAYLPFPALIPDQPVVMTPSGSTHVFLSEEAPRPGRGVLALGDPVYGERVDADAKGVFMPRSELTPLPQSRKEAEAVGDVVLLGAEATEAGLAAALAQRERWRSLHLACHGLIDPRRPGFSSLALTRAGDDDGFLNCLEVFRMPVPADTVVLSACRTARDRVYRGEGIVGLTSAFMYAGAMRVLCSLWRVDDVPSRMLMEKFYALWNPRPKPGEPPETAGPRLGAAEALRRAQAFVRAQPDFEHPHAWAAWVLWGQPD
jgi:CHAT domain-containing protein/tetratricopeptide (TPR) repeat protein